MRVSLLSSLLLAVTLAAAPRALAAQVAATPDTTVAVGALTGMVTDSLGRRGPLPDAEVWVEGSALTGTTDRTGAYRIQGLPAGEYRVTFSHPSLDSLGIGAPVRAVQVMAGTDTRLDLATPSASSIIAAVCGVQPDTTLGLVVGSVRDAVTGEPLSGTSVSASWSETLIGTTGIRRVERSATGTTNASGVYSLCGVPTDVAVLLQGERGAAATGLVELLMDTHRVVGRDLAMSLADSAVVATDAQMGAPPLRTGTAVLRGMVRMANGGPAAQALVLVLGTPATTRTDSTGAFRLSGLPAGTQTVEVRTIGYAPSRRAVNLRPGQPAELTVAIDRAQELPSVEVLAERRRSRLPDFERRRETGLGRYLDREQIEQRNPMEVTDLLRTIPGMRVVWNGTDYDVVSSRGAASLSSASCKPALYIDGSPVMGDDISPNTFVRPNDVEAMEVYRGADTPAQFQRMGSGGSGCGAIVIWTRRGR